MATALASADRPSSDVHKFFVDLLAATQAVCEKHGAEIDLWEEGGRVKFEALTEASIDARFRFIPRPVFVKAMG